MTDAPLPHGMHCREISGGNRAEDSTIRTPGLEIRIISRPLDGAGGDVHYVSLCGHGLITRMLLVDVSGHGAPVAKLAVDLQKLITQHSIDLELGDRVLLYADLLIETLNRGGAPLGEEGVLDAVRRIPWNSQAVSPTLLEEILSNAGPDSPDDDVTILEFRHIGNGRQPPAPAASHEPVAMVLRRRTKHKLRA